MIESTNLNELAAAESPTSRQLEDTGQKSNNKSPSSSPSSSSWLRLKDPRIVRVSRAFGGKDRHSKVCTVRGLRDRRVRLSVPTAIQLYDLQERLGLNQPSKAVDWLLNAAKHDIDDLPPLPIPPGGFSFNHQIMLSQPYNSKPPAAATVHEDHPTPSNFWSKRHDEDDVDDDNNNNNEEEEEEEEQRQQQWLINNSSVVPFGTGGNYHLEAQSFGFPTMATSTSGTQDQENSLHDHNLDHFKFMELPPTLSLSSSSGTHPILVPSNQELDPRTISDHHHHHHRHLQMLSSSSAQTNNVNVPPFFGAHQSHRPFKLN